MSTETHDSPAEGPDPTPRERPERDTPRPGAAEPNDTDGPGLTEFFEDLAQRATEDEKDESNDDEPVVLAPDKKRRRLEELKAKNFKPIERLNLLDIWQRSGLPAGEFASLVGVSKHTLYGWKKRFDEKGPAGLEDRPRDERRQGDGTGGDEDHPAEEPRLRPPVGNLAAEPVADGEIEQDQPDDVRPHDRRAPEVGREQPRGGDLGGERGRPGRENDDAEARPADGRDDGHGGRGGVRGGHAALSVPA